MTEYYEYTLTIETIRQTVTVDSHPDYPNYETTKGGYICQTTVAVSSPEHEYQNFQRKLANEIYEDHCAIEHGVVKLLAWKAEKKKYISIIPIHTAQ